MYILTPQPHVHKLCAGIPSSPAPITTLPPEVRGNSVTVSWLPSLDAGGCADGVFYNVYLLQNGETEYQRHNTVGITMPCPSNSSLFCYMIEDLTIGPYSIAIVAASCATNDPPSVSDLRLFQDRFILFFVISALPGT